MPRFITFFLLPFFLAGCAGLDDYNNYLRGYGLPSPTLQSFSHCYDYGCKTVRDVTISEQDWQVIQSVFIPPSKDAEQERQRISKAIGLFETVVGEMTGTKADMHGTFKLYTADNSPTQFQQDCVDESTNTTVYLALLQKEGLISFHDVIQPGVRWPISGGGAWWHQTAVIREIGSGEKFAVDSWFTDNGAPAYVVPYTEWSNGWKPDLNSAKKPGNGPS